MTSPQKKLAKSLEVLRSLQDRGVVAIRSSDLTRTHKAGTSPPPCKRPTERVRLGTHRFGLFVRPIYRNVLGRAGASLLSSHYYCMSGT